MILNTDIPEFADILNAAYVDTETLAKCLDCTPANVRRIGRAGVIQNIGGDTKKRWRLKECLELINKKKKL